MLGHCIGTDFLDHPVDSELYKDGKYLPCIRIPIFPSEKIAETKPDCVLNLPRNLKDEIMSQFAHIPSWGARFVVLPEVWIT